MSRPRGYGHVVTESARTCGEIVQISLLNCCIVARDAPDLVALARRLESTCGTGTVEGPGRLSGGASRESWSFDLVRADGSRKELVLRRDPAASALESARSTEYALLEAAAAAGVPVPPVRTLLQPADGLGRGFVMDRIEGETIPRRILRGDEYAKARSQFASQAGEIAARIHAVATTTIPELDVLDVDTQLDQQRTWLDTFGEPHPAFELALRWLTDNRPTAGGPPHLVHGDFRNGNFIV